MDMKVPSVVFKTRVRDESVEGDNPFRWQDVCSDDIFKDKKVVILALPGAFTPTCSSTHLPGYENRYQEILDQGIDEVYCLSVNDAFTMYQWSKNLKVENVKMLPDGNGDFTRAMGMLVKKENLGFGDRSWRYSMVVDNGDIQKLFVEPGKVDNCADDPFTCSDVNTMMDYLKSPEFKQTVTQSKDNIFKRTFSSLMSGGKEKAKSATKLPTYWAQRASPQLKAAFMKAQGEESKLSETFKCIVTTNDGHVPELIQTKAQISEGTISAELSLNDIDKVLKTDKKVSYIQGGSKMSL
jgi:peroxiredoxin